MESTNNQIDQLEPERLSADAKSLLTSTACAPPALELGTLSELLVPVESLSSAAGAQTCDAKASDQEASAPAAAAEMEAPSTEQPVLSPSAAPASQTLEADLPDSGAPQSPPAVTAAVDSVDGGLGLRVHGAFVYSVPPVPRVQPKEKHSTDPSPVKAPALGPAPARKKSIAEALFTTGSVASHVVAAHAPPESGKNERLIEPSASASGEASHAMSSSQEKSASSTSSVFKKSPSLFCFFLCFFFLIIT